MQTQFYFNFLNSTLFKLFEFQTDKVKKEGVKKRLLSEEGKEIYNKRKVGVEIVFGIVKKQ